MASAPLAPPAPDRLTRGECGWLGLRIVETLTRAGAESPGRWDVDACVNHLRHADHFCVADARTAQDLAGCRGTFAR